MVSDKNRYLGTGFWSEKSKIRIRIISRNTNDRFDETFFKRRISYAWDYRKTVMAEDLDACRVIFGEADQFPGLTVDRYGELLVTQTLSIGIEKLKPMLFPLIYKVLTEDGQRISGIYERNDLAIRELEGLEQNKGWFALEGVPQPESAVTVIRENGIEYDVDVENGQKTGFFPRPEVQPPRCRSAVKGQARAGLLHAYRLVCAQRGARRGGARLRC